MKVYIPPKPPFDRVTFYADLPNGSPPEVHYMGVSENYWIVLRQRKIRYMSSYVDFSDEQMNWLTSIKPEVENRLMG